MLRSSASTGTQAERKAQGRQSAPAKEAAQAEAAVKLQAYGRGLAARAKAAEAR